MVLTNFHITFDNPWRTYHSGQLISGKVILTVDSPKKIRSIYIQLKGEASVKFDQRMMNKTIMYIGSEKYFENKLHLLGDISGETMLAKGEHSYKFNTTLPLNLPSSFEEGSGQIRYTAKATIDRPWKFDQETKTAFTVISHLDLNLQPTAMDAIRVTKEKFFCCCCCKSGPLTFVVSLPMTGFVCGQEIPITLEVDNASEKELSNVTCELRKIVIFHAKIPLSESCEDKLQIAQMSFGQVDKKSSNIWTRKFIMPSLPPSNLTNCKIIDLTYEFKLEGLLKGIASHNIKMKIPIIVGTIPLLSTHPYNPDRKEDQFINQKIASPSSSNPNLSFPIYTESMLGARNIQDSDDSKFVRGDLNFTPRYPVYNFLPTAPIADAD